MTAGAPTTGAAAPWSAEPDAPASFLQTRWRVLKLRFWRDVRAAGCPAPFTGATTARRTAGRPDARRAPPAHQIELNRRVVFELPQRSHTIRAVAAIRPNVGAEQWLASPGPPIGPSCSCCQYP